jgi:hypothetical protein
MKGIVRIWGIGARIVSAWRCDLDERFNAKFGAALLAFNGEAVVYCRRISDIVAQKYAMEYAGMLQNRAKGIEAQRPRIRPGPSSPIVI